MGGRGVCREVAALLDAVAREDLLRPCGRSESSRNSVFCDLPTTKTFARLTAVDSRGGDARGDGASRYSVRYSQSQAECELQYLRGLSHPHIAMLLQPDAVFASIPAVVRVTSRCGGTLHAVYNASKGRGTPTAACIRHVLQTLLQVTAYLHERDIAHRRISPRHVLVAAPDEENWWRDVRLSGFREASRFGSCAMVGQPAEARFRSPDMCRRISYCEKVDVWAAAATCAEAVGCTLSDGVFRAGLHAFSIGRYPPWLSRGKLGSNTLEACLRGALATCPPRRKSALASLEVLSGKVSNLALRVTTCHAASQGPRKRRLEPDSNGEFGEWRAIALFVRDCPSFPESIPEIRHVLSAGGFPPDLIASALPGIAAYQAAAKELGLRSGRRDALAAHILATRGLRAAPSLTSANVSARIVPEME